MKTQSKPATRTGASIKKKLARPTRRPLAKVSATTISKPKPLAKSSAKAPVKVKAKSKAKAKPGARPQIRIGLRPEKVVQAGRGGNGVKAGVVKGGPRYDSGVRFDSGVSYAVGDPVETPVQTGIAAKVKLGLSERNNANVIDFGRTHERAIGGHTAFPAPWPTPAVFDAALAELEALNEQYEQMRLELKALGEQRNQARAAFDAIFTQRGTYVELQSGGDPVLIQQVALPVKNPSLKLPPLAPPIGLRTDLNGVPGNISIRWETVAGARSYLLERSVVLPDGERNWSLMRVGPSQARLTDLVVGTRYAFRVAAVGGAGGRSPWSPEVERVAG